MLEQEDSWSSRMDSLMKRGHSGTDVLTGRMPYIVVMLPQPKELPEVDLEQVL